MRIIAGSKKRLNLYGPDTDKIRPTTDRAKEALFNIINLKVKNSTFLDLFGGTGAISLEAKSRGAKEVIIVDNFDKSISLIKKNIERSKLNIEVIKSDSFNYIKNSSKKFDIIFLDPPFNISDEDVFKLLDEIFLKEILNDEGIIIVERQSKKDNQDIYSKYDNLEVRKYGKVSFLLIK